MPPTHLSSLPVELFERILEDLELFDTLHLKLLDRQAYQIICCSNRVKYRVELFLAGLEDGNYYSLAERQQFLHSYQSNWDSLTPQKTTKIPVPHHALYELAGGVYGLVPESSPDTVQFYRLPSVSRGIEMEEWSIQGLDFPIDDFTMECAHDLLIVFAYRTGHVKVHLLKLSDGKPHPGARKPLIEYEIPLNPGENRWEIESVIWENRVGCLFTSASANELVDSLVVWDWTTGDLVRVLSHYGNHSFIFLNDNIIVAGRSTEDNRPSLAFFDLTSDENPAIPPPTLEYPYEGADGGTLRRMRLNLGIPIRHGPELQARVPFVVNHSQQMLLVTASFTDLDSVVSRSIAVPVSALRDLAQANEPLVQWEGWERHSVPMLKAGDTRRATFTMGSRFAVPEFAILVNPGLPFAAEPDASIALVYDMSPLRRMRVGWDPSMPHCQGISGVWNTVTTISDNGGYRRAMQVLNELPSDILMTEDSLIIVEMDFEGNSGVSLTVLSF